MKAEPHPRQIERIAALRSYEILDTPQEADFDDIVKLTAQLCNAPISVVNLIDSDRQWFKAELGLGVRETPIDTSLCSHAILEETYVEIPDTLTDCRMQDNPLCQGSSGLRFYAGTLLKTADGLPLGTLCVLDYRPRQLTDDQRFALRVLGNQVMKQLELRLALKHHKMLLEEIDHRVKNSLQSVASMVRLQGRQAGDEARHVLAAIEKRIARVSILHDHLYRSTSATDINLPKYLSEVRDLLAQSLPANVELALKAEDIIVDAARASALGVIVSEFVMNAGKHGFPDGRAGQIGIELWRGEDGSIVLRCWDNGVGCAEPSHACGGIGLKLIEASARQFRGDVQWLNRDAGFGMDIRMPA